MAIQTTYNLEQGEALAGNIVDNAPSVVNTYKASEAVAFGLAVEQGSADNIVDVAAASGKCIGIALRATLINDGTTNAYKADEMVAVIEKGRVWAEVVGAATKNSLAYAITSGGDKGKLTATEGTNLLVGVFASSATDDLVKLDVDPNLSLV
jgi:hypothetical protein